MKNKNILIGIGVLTTIAIVVISVLWLASEKGKKCENLADGSRNIPCFYGALEVMKSNLSEAVEMCDRMTAVPKRDECYRVIASEAARFDQELARNICRKIENFQNSTRREECLCNVSGGTVSTSLCCQSTKDFPNTCLINACGCAPNYSHEVRICDCGKGMCFNGTNCVSILTISINMDKAVYHSHETANINLSVSSPLEVQNVTVRLHGINARGSERLKLSQNVNLASGLNIIPFQYTMPSCTGCAGIRPGDYEIFAEVESNGQVIARSNTTVNIQQ